MDSKVFLYGFWVTLIVFSIWASTALITIAINENTQAVRECACPD